MNPGQPQIITPGNSAGSPSMSMPAVKGEKPPASNLDSTQNTLHISEIRDGIAIMNDGTFRAVIMCKAINFDLMSPQEREAVEFAYQGFLNSLYFPIQIFVRSQRVDISPYLDKLDKIRSEQESMLIALLMEDYVAFLAEIAARTNIMDKKFYIIIGYPDADADIRRTLKTSAGFFTGVRDLFSSNKSPQIVVNESVLEDAKTQLKNRVQAAMQGLLQCGVQSVPLDTQELIELYYEAYNPDTAANQQLANVDQLNAEVISKGQGNAPSPNLDRTAT